MKRQRNAAKTDFKQAKEAQTRYIHRECGEHALKINKEQKYIETQKKGKR